MSDWGFQSWDANGVPNNYGIKPVSVISNITLSNGQKSGSYSFNVPDGYRLGFVYVPLGADTYIQGRRIISISGNSIIISAGTDNSLNQYQSGAANLTVFLEVA